MVTDLAFFACLALFFAGYAYLGRFAVSKGYKAGESGGTWQLAWPFFIPLAPWFLGVGLGLLVAAAVVALHD